MQSSDSSNHIDGDGIYDKSEVAQQTNFNYSFGTSPVDLVESENQVEFSLNERLEQILDNLDKQIGVLDEIHCPYQSDQQVSSNSSAISNKTLPPNFSTRITEKFHSSLDDCVENPLDRELRLKRYIEQDICEEASNCGCHFSFATEEKNNLLPVELDECYRKFSTAIPDKQQHRQLVESNHVALNRSARVIDDTLTPFAVDDIIRQQRACSVGGAAADSSNRRQGYSLYIDGFNEQLGSRLKQAQSKTRTNNSTTYSSLSCCAAEKHKGRLFTNNRLSEGGAFRLSESHVVHDYCDDEVSLSDDDICSVGGGNLESIADSPCEFNFSKSPTRANSRGSRSCNRRKPTSSKSPASNYNYEPLDCSLTNESTLSLSQSSQLDTSSTNGHSLLSASRSLSSLAERERDAPQAPGNSSQSEANLLLPLNSNRISLDLERANSNCLEYYFDEQFKTIGHRSATGLQSASCRDKLSFWEMGSDVCDDKLGNDDSNLRNKSKLSETENKNKRILSSSSSKSSNSLKQLDSNNKKSCKRNNSQGAVKQEGARQTGEHFLDCADNTNLNENATNMKAVRDIALKSVPSLSALQYLPGQMDLKTKTKALLASSESSASAPNKDSPNVQAKRDKSIPVNNVREKVEERVGAVGTDRKEDIGSDDPCLFHRLCLCNCMSRSHHMVESLEAPSQRATAPNKSTFKHRVRSFSASLAKATSSESESSKLQAKCDFSRDEAGQQKRDYEKPSSSQLKPTVAAPNFNSFRTELKINSNELSPDVQNVDELATNSTARNCCNSDQPHSDGLKQALKVPHARTSSSSERRSLSACDNSNSSQHEYSTIPQNFVANTKKSHLYPKFLTPKKLFAKSTSHSNLQDHSCQEKQLEQKSSFLSRSFSRLSGRRRQVPKKGAGAHQIECLVTSIDTKNRASCASPTISVSNASQQDSLSDSINSLEDANLPDLTNPDVARRGRISRLLNAPEIILSKVEYSSELDSLSCSKSCEMGRPTSHKSFSGRSRTSHQAPLPRQGSDMSNYSRDVETNSHGPFSLPSSPRAIRRSRSPRLSQSPISFVSPSTESTKIEDGLKICSIEHFEKHIGNIKDNQIEAQKRLFTAWINHFCPNLIRHDLIEELRDGIKLIGLVATLTRDKQLLSQFERLNRDKQSHVNRMIVSPSSRLQHLSNVSIAIDYLRKSCKLKLVNLNSMDIVSGKSNVILGLCWNIILFFQLEQSTFKNSDTSSNYSSDNSLNVSQISSLRSNMKNENENVRNISQMAISSLTEEYSNKDLTTAKKRILNHLNKRFNLKLTSLTSNFLDGDVLRVVLRQILPKTDIIEYHLEQNSDGKTWNRMNNLEKLDHCFKLANTHLNVPILFSASDLKQQTMSSDNSKALLVYLSMLLTVDSKPSNSIEQQPEVCRTDNLINPQSSTVNNQGHDKQVQIETRFAEYLSQIDVAERFEVDKIQASLDAINKFDELLRAEDIAGKLNTSQVDKHASLKREAEQVEALIAWINQADKLFETSQKSSADLTEAIESYQEFFSPHNLPKVEVALCATLERQYRECLATAKQRVLSMQQTMKNWISYEQARRELKEWLQNAESTLVSALRPSQHLAHDVDPLEQHLNNLSALIHYFELEPSEFDDDSLLSISDRLSLSSFNIDQPVRSLSGSLISLGSNSSRYSTLTASKKATYINLFNDFELKCRLLAAMLDSDQRDALLLGVKELKSKLKYITEYKVPQAVNELRLNINRCEMSIKEQDEGDDELATNAKSIGDEDIQSLNSNDEVVDDCAQENNHTKDHPIESNFPENSPRKNKKRRKYYQKKSNKSENRKQLETCPKPVDKSDKPAKPETSYMRMFWNKLVRASKLSLSFNIIFFICLAGICVVPLLNKDACCELSQAPLVLDNHIVNQKPT